MNINILLPKLIEFYPRKFYFKMEEQKQPTNYPGVVDQKEVDSLNNILKELNIEETNSPPAPKKPQRYTSFGGRVRIDVLTSEGAEKWIGKIIQLDNRTLCNLY